MHFFYGNETLSNFDWIMRAVVTFFIMVMTAKFMGQRSLSQLRLLDFVVALMLGNIIAHPLSDPTIGMDGSIITTLVIAVLYISGILLSLKWEWLRKFTDPAPMLLIKDGEINYKALRKARITLDYLLSELRKEKIEDVKKVALALWESDGKMSIFLDPQFDPITPSTYQLKTKPFDLPMILIKEGKINTQRLQQINKEEQWLLDRVKTLHQTQVSNVLLATIDCEDNLEVFFYR
ncbi:DUF421 domain-containing protein [Neobacillus massiliamazoniensis]|uniref:YdfS n=1 Tax=Neobacillus massiliamazoniensis TaxID=1499688 RepID=A0A0U1NUP6_9BACI|nr:DUF421 domain-containing protein [Neobacillus massiliamazoniensis]CRK81695.1 YdfS [Neobacillus massiliamazoniensis]